MSKRDKRSTALAVQSPGEISVVPATATAPSGTDTIVGKLIELARDPGVDVSKINALIDANERVMAIAAKQAFDRDFAEMQGELPVITQHGLARVEKNGEIVRETPYTRDVDITIAVRPILAKYGFAIRHRNRMQDGVLTVTGILSHRAGHREEDEFQTGRDDTGAKNQIQSWGSARAYGKRYTTISLLCISSDRPIDGDDDGAATGPVTHYDRAKSNDSGDTRPISYGTKEKPGQAQRLWTILRNSGRNEKTFKDWLYRTYGYDSTKKIQRRHYDDICRAIEAPGGLPNMPTAKREPGEEG